MEKIKLAYKSYQITAYHRPGDAGEKLVFLHGGGLDNAMLSWKEVIELMGEGYDIYAVDMIGYGESDKPDIQYSIPLYSDFLYETLKQLNIERTHLVGLSLGGGTAIAFSLEHPEMVNKLVLVDPHGMVARIPFHALGRWTVNSRLYTKSYEWMAKSRKFLKWSTQSVLIGNKNKLTEELLSTFQKLCEEPGGVKAWNSLQRYEMGKHGLTTDLASHLSELSMPVLLVNGEKDSSVPVKSAIAASKTIPDCRLHVMKGCKHWAQKERPEEFVQVLREFLQ